jgi:hypothetical protein
MRAVLGKCLGRERVSSCFSLLTSRNLAVAAAAFTMCGRTAGVAQVLGESQSVTLSRA